MPPFPTGKWRKWGFWKIRNDTPAVPHSVHWQFIIVSGGGKRERRELCFGAPLPHSLRFRFWRTHTWVSKTERKVEFRNNRIPCSSFLFLSFLYWPGVWRLSIFIILFFAWLIFFTFSDPYSGKPKKALFKVLQNGRQLRGNGEEEKRNICTNNPPSQNIAAKKRDGWLKCHLPRFDGHRETKTQKRRDMW